jgi:hypothetical protein
MILKKIKYIFSVNLKPYLFGFLIGIEFGDLNQLKQLVGFYFFMGKSKTNALNIFKIIVHILHCNFN